MANKNSHWAVRNINGTSDNKCECKGWLTHWKLATGSVRTRCAVVGCGRPAEVGAHVQITDGRSGAHWWIVPFCKTHNHYRNVGEMYIKRSVMLVSANRKETCQRGEWWKEL